MPLSFLCLFSSFGQHQIVQEQLQDLSVGDSEFVYMKDYTLKALLYLANGDNTIILENFVDIWASPDKSTKEVLES